MAFKLPKFISAADAKSRVFLIFAAVAGISFLVFIGVRFLTGGTGSSGPSRVATAPSSLQSVPGGKMSPEFYRAVQQANAQAAQQAQISGGSAIPTIINVPNQQPEGFSQPTGNCTVLCSDENVDVANDINDLVRSGKLSQEDANHLLDLAKRNVSVDEYAAALNELVRQGKLTPEQARMLLERYKKQHQAKLTAESAQMMDGMIKSGQMSLGTANELLALQKSNISPAEYAAELNRLVKAGKLTPEQAAQLLAQYTQQQAREATQSGIYGLKQMAKNGEITQDVADDLGRLQNSNAPVDQYSAELDRLVAAGKMTPAAAAKLLDLYKKQRETVGAMNELTALLKKQEATCITELNDLMNAGKVSADIANALFALQQKKIPLADYQAAVNAYAQDKKIAPETAGILTGCYTKLSNLRAMVQTLADMQGNNASVADYTAQLKKAVQDGVITPDMAKNLLQEYQTVLTSTNAAIIPTTQANIPGAEGFAQLTQRVQQNQGLETPAAAVNQEQFSQAATQAEQEMMQKRNERIQQIASQMSAQAQTLIGSWQPTPMVHKAGASETEEASKTTPLGGGGESGGAAGEKARPTGAPLIKAGSILFAVLDTAVDSDYPDTPVMATIVEGKFKGSKLMGKMAMPSGKTQLSLSFTMMNRDEWLTSKSISAYAIDPDTARTVMASSVDNHYLSRYGAMIASSFLSGYASAIQSSGSTTTTGIFGSTTSNPALSPGNKLAIGIGNVGTSLSKVVTNYVNQPPTVKVNSGVGLGILFMSDVTQ